MCLSPPTPKINKYGKKFFKEQHVLRTWRKYRTWRSEEKDRTQLAPQRQGLLGNALQSQKSKATVREKTNHF